VLERILHTLGYDLGLDPRVTFHDVSDGHGARYRLPDRLWHVAPTRLLRSTDNPQGSGESTYVRPAEPRGPRRRVHVASPAR